MGKYKLRPLSEAPKDGSFICVLHYDFSGAGIVFWDGEKWVGTDHHCAEIPDIEDDPAYLWFPPQRKWLETILRVSIERKPSLD